MNHAAPRSIEQYLSQLREALSNEDAALIQDALYDAEEYLRAEVAAHPDKSESDVLELIASTYGDPEEVAAAYRDTEVKVKAALKTPAKAPASRGALLQFFGIFSDPRAYTSVFFMLLSLATGIVYFTVAVTGLSMSIGLALLIIGVPFFLAFIGLTRIMSLAEGRLIEAMTGERMPRRPVHPGPATGFWSRIAAMLMDARTWTTLAYLMLMLPVGVVYFTTAVLALALSGTLIFAPLAAIARHYHWFGAQSWGDVLVNVNDWSFSPTWLGTLWVTPILVVFGVLLLTVFMHVARGIGRLHAHFAKSLLVAG
jgi:uncharacterized membrane protein